MTTKDPKRHAVEHEGTKLTLGGVIAIGLFILGLLSALKQMVVNLVDTLFGLAVSGGRALLIGLKWLGLLLLGVLLVLLLIGTIELAVQAWRSRRRQELVLQASPLPHNETIRGEPPTSELDRTTALPVHHQLELLGRDPASLSDRELALLRPHFPELFALPQYVAQINAAVVVPFFELLLEDGPKYETQLQRYGEVEQRQPFWLARRALHVVTRGRAGLSAEQVWRRPSVTELRADFSKFAPWFWQYGWPLVGWLERELAAKASIEGPSSVSETLNSAEPATPHAEVSDPEPDKDQPDSSLSTDNEGEPAQSPDRSLEIALDLLEEANAAKQQLEPWSDPACRIATLEAAGREALAWDPNSLEAQALLDDVQLMWARLPEFEQRFPEWMAGDESDWPPVMDAAFLAAADELTPETVKGHAARLYLTHRGDPAFLHSPHRSDEMPGDEKPLEPPASRPAPTSATSHLTLVCEPIEPSATERAETLF
jgi:hypothetical protein